MKWHEAIALFLIILLAAVAADLIAAWVISQKVQGQISNFSLGSLLGLPANNPAKTTS